MNTRLCGATSTRRRLRAYLLLHVPNAFRSREAVDDDVKRKSGASLCQFLNFNAKRETTFGDESNFKNASSYL
jgi:hypothetical protein